MLKAQFPFVDLPATGDITAGVRLQVNLPRSMAGIVARKGMKQEVAKRIKNAFGVTLPEQPSVVTTGSVGFVGSGPDSWLAVDETGSSDLFGRLCDTLSGVAAVCDQSDGFSGVRVGGPDVYRMLAKGVPLDLHPNIFEVGSAATTSIAHVGATLWRCPDEGGHSVFEIVVFRSMADSFLHWLNESATEFGLFVRDCAGSPE